MIAPVESRRLGRGSASDAAHAQTAGGPSTRSCGELVHPQVGVSETLLRPASPVEAADQPAGTCTRTPRLSSAPATTALTAQVPADSGTRSVVGPSTRS